MKKLVLCAVIIVMAAPLVAYASPTKTLDNLQAAFNGESNAHARYLEFAKKADQEGYSQVAALFRAAAKAEDIHAANHAVVIKKLGAIPTTKIDKIELKSTRENVQAAIKGETYERDVMYPEFLKTAREEKNRDAIETFNFAKTAETEHARLYTEANGNLDQMNAKGVKYYVCSICGYTTTKIDFEKCPACFNPKEQYITVT